jgi:hypothetical protein
MISAIALVIFIGVFLWLGNLHLVNVARDWPVILIVVGLVSLSSTRKKVKKRKIIDDLEKGKITVEEAEGKLRNAP